MLGKRGIADLESNSHVAQPQQPQQPQQYAVKRFRTVVDPVSRPDRPACPIGALQLLVAVSKSPGTDACKQECMMCMPLEYP